GQASVQTLGNLTLNAGNTNITTTATPATAPIVLANSTTTFGSANVTVSSVAGLAIGMAVSATNFIAPGTTIIAINPATNVVTLSQTELTTGPANVTLTFT